MRPVRVSRRYLPVTGEDSLLRPSPEMQSLRPLDMSVILVNPAKKIPLCHFGTQRERERETGACVITRGRKWRSAT